GGAACSGCDWGGGGGGGGGANGGDGGGGGFSGFGGGGGGGGTDFIASSIINPVDSTSTAGASADGTVSFTYTQPDTSSTAVSCSPSGVVLDQSMTCTATVTDTSPTGPTTPTGTVSLTSDPTGPGGYSPSSCT